jgi:tRNA pseudouridine55 synthase
MNGILLIDKPKNWTSFDVVAKVRGMVRQITGVKRSKVGHTGTLDPLATGLVVIVVGNYCKRAQEFSKLDKTYQVSACLGQTSTTGDEEGQKAKISDMQPTKEQVEAAIKQFVGQISQVPPAFSAIKIDGQRAYKLAREGKPVKIEPRQTTIYEITDVEYNYPVLSFTTKVSSGTYIRTLVEDIGQALGTGAYTTNLRRITVGDFSLKDAQQMAGVSTETLKDVIITL